MDDDRRKSRVLGIILISQLAILAGVLLIGIPFIYAEKLLSSVTVVSMILLESVSLLFLRKGNIRIASIALITGTWGISTIFITFSGSLHSILLLAYLFLPLLSVLLLGRRAAYAVSAASILATILFVVLDAYGVILPNPFPSPPIARMFTFAVILVFTLVPLELTLQDLNRALGNAQRELLERRRAEAQLAASEALLSAAIKQSPVGIIVADAKSKTIRFANKAAYAIRGGDPSHLVGIPLKEHAEKWRLYYPDGETPYPAEKLPLSRAIVQAVATDNEEMVIKDEQGGLHWLLANAGPVRNPEGGVAAGITIFHDITWRRNADRERDELSAQLFHAQKLESVGRLAGGVAHDFNNLLTVITGALSLAQRKLAPLHPALSLIDSASHACESAAALTRQLLAFSRRQIIEPRVLDLNQLLEGMHSLLRRVIGDDIALASIPQPSIGRIKADPGQVEQVMVNLAVNARDAMPDGGKITLETASVILDETYCSEHPGVQSGKYVMLAVSDTGIGMSAEVRQRIFEPFFTTKPVGMGSGLGLSTVWGVVKQHGGSIEVYSEPGQGSTFKIYFPEIADTAAAAQQDNTSAESACGGETILVVEDAPMVRDICVKMLELSGYQVWSAASGEEALSILSRQKLRIDLLITDVVMPDINGRDLAERLTQLQPGLKVLFCSGYTENVIAHHGVLDPGVNFLGKPYTPHALARKVREVLDASEQ